MLTKEKLSEIFNKAIGTRNYVCKIEPSSSQNSCTIRLYDGQPADDGLVANVYVSEDKVLGSFHVSFIPERSNKKDRKVLKMINSKLFDCFDKRIEPKYYIKLINNDYGYLAKVADVLLTTSLENAKIANGKVAFTADEINEMSTSEEFPNVDLWSIAEKVEEGKDD